MDRENKEICLLGHAGVLGCSLILSHRMEELTKRFRSRYLSKASRDHAKALAQSARALEFLESESYLRSDEEWVKAESAGVLAVLYEWCKSRKVGCRIEIRKIPLLQSGVEVCEFYGLNIYRLLSDCYLIFTNRGYELSSHFKSLGFTCEMIGCLQAGLDKVIVDKEELEHMNRPTTDEIRKMGSFDERIDFRNY